MFDENTTTSAVEPYEIAVPAAAVDRERLLSLRAMLGRQRGDTPVHLVITVPAVGRVVIDLSSAYAVRPSELLRQQLETLFEIPSAA